MAAQDWRSLMRIASQVSEEKRRRLLLDGIYSVVQNWQGPLPDLLEIFRPEKIECLLSYAVTDQKGDEEARKRFIKFVVDTGYRDQPKVGADGKPLLNRTTPVHLVFRVKIKNRGAMAHLLFEIYDRYDLNYIDGRGFTHFHAACSIPDSLLLVARFLNHGQNPNSIVRGYSVLRWALRNDTDSAAELLRRGSDPTRVDNDGSTALHIFCRDRHEKLLKLFFKIADDNKRTVQIDARDTKGRTPLCVALLNANTKVAAVLLSRGADPNSADNDGWTPLHIICMKCYRFLSKFFGINARRRKLVQINAKTKNGETPLNLLFNQPKSFKSYKILEQILLRQPNFTNNERLTNNL